MTPITFQAFTSADVAAMDDMFRRNFINSITGFKSVALVGTADEHGNTNLAIFSQVIHVGAHPPCIGILFRPHSVTRHTLENIKSTGCFTVNHIAESFVNAAHQTSARYAGSEYVATGLTPLFSTAVKAPYVAESPLRIGLELREIKKLDVNDTELVVGEIKEIALPDGVVGPDGFTDLEKVGSITCSGLDSYHRTSRITRLSYAKPGKTPVAIA